MLTRNINRNKCILFLWKNPKNVIPRRETDSATQEKEPNHPEHKKKINLPKLTDDNNAINVDIYDEKDKMNQIQLSFYEKTLKK